MWCPYTDTCLPVSAVTKQQVIGCKQQCLCSQQCSRCHLTSMQLGLTCSPAVTPVLSYTRWSSCSSTCGGGTQPRTATCINSVNNAALALSQCSTPITSQSCNTQACAPVATPAPTSTGSTSGSTGYTWQYASGGWSTCSAQRGGGVITSAANCINSAGTIVPDSNCAYHTSKPASQMNCNTQACVAGTFVWGAAAWSTCSAICGGGTTTRK